MISLLFDPRPKISRDELYDRDYELNKLLEFLENGSPIMVMYGVRRIGKTSILNVFLNETNVPHIYIDARVFEDQGYNRETLYRVLSNALNKLRSRWSSVLEYIKMLEGVEIMGANIRFNRRRTGLSITDIFNTINEWGVNHGIIVIISVDEAQQLRYFKGGKGRVDFTNILSYCYDNLRNLKFIVTGSEMGVLRDFLGFDRPESPLYGRVRDEVTIDRFNRQKSLDFLEKGFDECGFKPGRTVLEEIVDAVDGIPGWLTFSGYKYCKNRDPRIIREIFDEEKAIVLSELRKLPSEYYRLALKAVSLGNKRWRSIKQALEIWVNHSLTKAQISRTLNILVKLGLIEKREGEYEITDPIVAEVAKEL
ncbi:MAG: ATP-binding protein [Desulfurococcales archaeon]|nr:ATP-binding protein [Desulfurococcales archaeon]